jgi:hypothetical protein
VIGEAFARGQTHTQKAVLAKIMKVVRKHLVSKTKSKTIREGSDPQMMYQESQRKTRLPTK